MKTRSLYCVPALLFFLPFLLFPLVDCLGLSRFVWDGITQDKVFVGLGHYRALWLDPVMRSSLGHNALLILFSLLFQLSLAFLLALFVSKLSRGARLMKGALLTPLMLSPVACGLLWGDLLDPHLGPIQTGLRGLGILSRPQGWLSDPGWSLFWIFIAISWRHVGFHVLLMLAGLERIPRQTEEAARVDGAGRLGVTFHITLPLMGKTVALCGLLSVVGSLKYFDLVYAMTRGGPAHATELVATYAYKLAFDQSRMGYACAAFSVLFGLTFGAGVLYRLLRGRSG